MSNSAINCICICSSSCATRLPRLVRRDSLAIFANRHSREMGCHSIARDMKPAETWCVGNNGHWCLVGAKICTRCDREEEKFSSPAIVHALALRANTGPFWVVYALVRARTSTYKQPQANCQNPDAHEAPHATPNPHASASHCCEREGPSYRLPKLDAREIIYPGAKHDPWWDMPQLIKQTRIAIQIFEYLYLNGIAVFIFDCSSAHEAFASDALLAHKMNRGPGGAQPKMHDTINPTTGEVQQMVHPLNSTAVDDDGNSLAGQPKGMEVLLGICYGSVVLHDAEVAGSSLTFCIVFEHYSTVNWLTVANGLTSSMPGSVQDVLRLHRGSVFVFDDGRAILACQLDFRSTEHERHHRRPADFASAFNVWGASSGSALFSAPAVTGAWILRVKVGGVEILRGAGCTTGFYIRPGMKGWCLHSDNFIHHENAHHNYTLRARGEGGSALARHNVERMRTVSSTGGRACRTAAPAAHSELLHNDDRVERRRGRKVPKFPINIRLGKFPIYIGPKNFGGLNQSIQPRRRHERARKRQLIAIPQMQPQCQDTGQATSWQLIDSFREDDVSDLELQKFSGKGGPRREYCGWKVKCAIYYSIQFTKLFTLLLGAGQPVIAKAVNQLPSRCFIGVLALRFHLRNCDQLLFSRSLVLPTALSACQEQYQAYMDLRMFVGNFERDPNVYQEISTKEIIKVHFDRHTLRSRLPNSKKKKKSLARSALASVRYLWLWFGFCQVYTSQFTEKKKCIGGKLLLGTRELAGRISDGISLISPDFRKQLMSFAQRPIRI
ncbi:hypothetical protein C8R45DRAFT_938619 [Mycena sanguinolenta]|nr:hypothetical protein C8R45DRAFT_938619 [Mycena sanguinolenta]